MAHRQVIVSDLTGKVIEDAGQAAELRILNHPLLDHAVKLDAFVLEVASLEGSKRDLVTVELVLPNTPPETLLVEVKDLDKLIKVGSADDVLNSAERYYGNHAKSDIAPKRRGRPAGSTNTPKPTSTTPNMSREQREAIRSWANENGFTVGPRGRIAANVVQAFEDAHTF